QRYWDGSAWQDAPRTASAAAGAEANVPPAAPAPAQPKKKKGRGLLIGTLIVVGVTAIAGLGSALGGGGIETTGAPADSQEAAAPETEPADPAAAGAAEPAEPAEPALSLSQQNAVVAANSYLTYGG